MWLIAITTIVFLMMVLRPLGFADEAAGGGDAAGDAGGAAGGGDAAGDAGGAAGAGAGAGGGAAGGDAGGGGTAAAASAKAPDLTESQRVFGSLSAEDQDWVIEQGRKALAGPADKVAPAAEGKPSGNGDGPFDAEREIKSLRAELKSEREQTKKDQETTTFLKGWEGKVSQAVEQHEFTKDSDVAPFVTQVVRGILAVNGVRNPERVAGKVIDQFKSTVEAAAKPLAEEMFSKWKAEFVAGKIKAADVTRGEKPGGGAPARGEEETKPGDLESGELKRRAMAKRGIG